MWDDVSEFASDHVMEALDVLEALDVGLIILDQQSRIVGWND